MFRFYGMDSYIPQIITKLHKLELEFGTQYNESERSDRIKNFFWRRI